jgi:aspartyl-tRNA(Asn)/glutamyl-tRNA(Gln) amidotransferase subunit A
VSDLHHLSAVEALALFRARGLSPVELMQALIVRAEDLEPSINAFAVTHFERALDQARAAEARYAAGDARPLEGLPVAIKDEVPIEGDPCSQGSLFEADTIADHTAPIARRILEAGGIVHGRTTTPEFSCAGFTHSRLWGVTRNPWAPEWSPGGSSGGSAAALAAGMATLASGSDIGGSIRIPASFCGVVGFKPPYGRVPVDPPYNLDHYCHDGPMARTVADCALFENVIAGPDPSDVVSIRPKLEIPEQLEGVEGLRIALCLRLGDFPLDPEVEVNTLAEADGLREAGATVDEVELPWRREDIIAPPSFISEIFGRDIGRAVAEHGDLMTLRARDGRVVAGGDRANELPRRAGARGADLRALGALLERYEALVCPTVGTRGLIAGDDYVDHGLEVGGVALGQYLDVLMTPPFNIASRCPVLAVPSGSRTTECRPVCRSSAGHTTT